MCRFQQKEKWAVGLAIFFCFVIHLIIIRQFANWYCTDVEGYLCHAATFSGKDWSGVFRNATYFYSWGYSLLLTVPMLFTNNITVVHYIAIFLNALLCCGIMLLCYGIAKTIAKDVDNYILLLCSFAVSLYSSYIFNGAVMLSEIFLCFFVLLNVFLLLRYLQTDNFALGILTGFSVGYTYIIHNRAVAVVIAYIMVAVIWSVKSKNWKRLFTMLIPVVVMFILNLGVVEYLDIKEKQGEVYIQNTYANQMNRITSNIQFYTIISLAEGILGECWYAMLGAFGIIGMGIYSVGEKTYRLWTQKSKEIIWYFFLILILIGTLGVSVLGSTPKAPLGENGRYDLYIYGRYWETVLGIFILLGFIECLNNFKRNVGISFLLGSCFLSLIVNYITVSYQNNGYNFWAITAVLTTFFFPERKFNVISSSFVGIIFMAMIFYMFAQRKRFFSLFAIAIWILFNVFTGYNVIYNVSSIYRDQASVISMPLYNEDFRNLCEYLNDYGVEEFAVCTKNGYRAIPFQLIYPDKKVIGITSQENWFETEFYIIDKSEWEEKSDRIVLYENESYYVEQM